MDTDIIIFRWTSFVASIYFKNAIRRYWFETESTPAHLKISESDKDAIKVSIIQLLASSPPVIR